ncbi:MAG: tetratricopeptide repeat protein [Methanoregula sp.]|nr:tetratricopeptide repeat protein [Methanoregula sp.]
MRINKMVTVIIAVLLVLVLSSGCVNNSSVNKQIETATPAIPSLELHRSGFDAFIDGKYETALDYYNKSLAADPKYTRAWIDKGNVLIRLNRTSEAISAYDSALALENNLSQVWNSRGEALMTLGRYTEALESFDSALKIAPEYAKAIENRNLTHAKLK